MLTGAWSPRRAPPWARVLVASLCCCRTVGERARVAVCCVPTPSCELRAASCGQVGPRHLGSREQNWGPGLRFAARLLGRPSGRAERSALGAPARCICRSGRTTYSRALAADPADPADQNRLTSPERPAFLTATCSCSTGQGRALLRSVRYLATVLSLPGLLSPQPPTARLRFAFLCLPFPHPPVPHPVLSIPVAVTDTVPRARACPVAVSARRVWSRQETLSPSQPVFWSRLLMAVPAPATA